jgi:hypothetical protein
MYNKHDKLQYWCPVLYKVEPSSEMPCPSCSPVLTYISERYIANAFFKSVSYEKHTNITNKYTKHVYACWFKFYDCSRPIKTLSQSKQLIL